MENDITEEEREELRRLTAFQRVAWQIVIKWKWLFLGLFLAFSVCFSLYIVWRYAVSGHRYTAETRLSYMPRKISRVENLSDRQLFSILERTSLKRRVADLLSMPRIERECLSIDLNIVQERRPSSLYTLTAKAPGRIAAIAKVNTYAKVLMDEYREYRSHDLKNMQESAVKRKERILEQMAELDGEESIEKGKSGVASPIDTLTTINALLSDQRRDLSLMKVQLSNEDIRKQRLEKAVGAYGTSIVKNASVIREKSAKLAALDKEIAELRELYTDINPKVRGKLEDREEIVREYAALLKENGIEGMALDEVAQIEHAAGELSDVQLRLEVLSESIDSMEQSIHDNEERSAALTAVIPALERINSKRADLEKTLRSLDEQIDDIEYLRTSLATDLRQIERAGGASDRKPLQTKSFVIAFGVALFCTFGIGVWILAIEFLFGKVRSAKELSAFGDVTLIGSIPTHGVMPENEEKDILGVVALRLCSSQVPIGVVVVCRLPGVSDQTHFFESVEWSLAMSGKRAFTLELVQSAKFAPPEDATPMVSAFRKNERGWFPVENGFMLVPSELEMLQADLTMLKSEFDTIFVTMPGGVRRGGSFFSQILSVSDSALIIAGANATPRAWLSYARRTVMAAGKPALGILSGVSAKVAEREMEAPNE